MKPQRPAVIPRKLLFGNPERTDVTVSPDGTKLAFLAPVKGVLNVWVAPPLTGADRFSRTRGLLPSRTRPQAAAL